MPNVDELLTKPWLIAIAHVTIVIAFVMFAILHVAWLIYIWRLDFKWRYAQALQRECGKNAMERETVRWAMNQTFNNDRALKSLRDFTITFTTLYTMAFAVAFVILVWAYLIKFRPQTEDFSALLEQFQAVPTKVYVGLIVAIFTIITAIKVRSSFGGNRLSNLMTDYKNSLSKIETTMKTMKERAVPAEDAFDDIQALREEVVKNIAIAHNMESLAEAESFMKTVHEKDLVGYLQIASAASTARRCELVQYDVIRFSKFEINMFINKLNNAKIIDKMSAFTTSWSSNFSKKYPEFMAYVNKLTQTNWPDFKYTWWDESGKLRISSSNYTNSDLWTSTLTPRICSHYKPSSSDGTMKWDPALYDLKNMDPSPKLKPMIRHLKIYFAIVFIFIMAILYMVLPKGNILPAAFASLLLVFMYAYLMQFSQ